MQGVEQNPTHMHDMAKALREMADQLDTVGPENIARYAIICAFVKPCRNETAEGFAHEEAGMVIGGNMELAAHASTDLTHKLLEIAPVHMLRSVLARVGEAHKPPQMPPAVRI